MPLSKKRQAEYQARRRKIVIPKEEIVIPNIAGEEALKQAITRIVQPNVFEVIKAPKGVTWGYCDEAVQPIPNCPDGRYGDATN